MPWKYSFKVVCNDIHPGTPKFEHLFDLDWKFVKTLKYEFTDDYLDKIHNEWIYWWKIKYKELNLD